MRAADRLEGTLTPSPVDVSLGRRLEARARLCSRVQFVVLHHTRTEARSRHRRGGPATGIAGRFGKS